MILQGTLTGCRSLELNINVNFLQLLWASCSLAMTQNQQTFPKSSLDFSYQRSTLQSTNIAMENPHLSWQIPPKMMGFSMAMPVLSFTSSSLSTFLQTTKKPMSCAAWVCCKWNLICVFFFADGETSKSQIFSAGITLPETNSSPVKLGHPKRKFIFQSSIFRGFCC